MAQEISHIKAQNVSDVTPQGPRTCVENFHYELLDLQCERRDLVEVTADTIGTDPFEMELLDEKTDPADAGAEGGPGKKQDGAKAGATETGSSRSDPRTRTSGTRRRRTWSS